MKSKKLVLLMAALLVSAVGCGNPDREYIAYEAAGFESVQKMEEAVLGAYDAKYQAAASITDATKIKESIR